MRVLLVENDVEFGRGLYKILTKGNYNVDWLRDGISASSAMRATNYAILLLSLNLPDTGGIRLLKRARVNGRSTPVLILDTSNDVEMRIHSLDIGADDCLSKQLDPREIFSRIRAVLRRKAGHATSCLSNGSFCLDLGKRTLSCLEKEHALSAREFALMHAFFERPGTLLSRRQLEERVYSWSREIDSNAVEVLIHSVRKKFGRSLIVNVRGMGWAMPSMRP